MADDKNSSNSDNQPTTPPLSQETNIPPGWHFQQSRPGTFAEVSAVVNKRVIDPSKIYNDGIDPNLPMNPGLKAELASNTVQGPASIVELARALKNDPQLIAQFVHDNIEWQIGWGVMKGALGCLMDGSGNAFDQSLLLAALLRQAGFTANIVLGQIQLTTTQFDAWFGTDSTSNSYVCYNYAQNANVPGDAPVFGTDWTMVMSHVWVQVVISGTTYVLDPSIKAYNRQISVAVAGTVTAGDVLTVTINDAALSGGTTNVNYTVLVTDTVNTISVAIASAINATSSLAAIGVTAGSTTAPMPAQFTISSKSSNATTYSFSTSVGATETLTVALPAALLASMMSYSSSTFLSDAESGATIDPSHNFVQNFNATNIHSDLTTMTSNVVSYIKSNTVGTASAGTAVVDDVLGGSTIVPITLPFTYQTTLGYEAPGDVPTVWTGDVPLAYKTTIEVQYPYVFPMSGWAIDQTYTSDQLAGGRLTLGFNSGLYPVLTFNGTVAATGSQAQGVGTSNSIQLTVTHNAIATTLYPYQWWQSFIYASQTNFYLIGNAWGNLGRGQADYHQRQLVAAIASTTATNEQTIGETLSHIWFLWAAQASRVGDLACRMASTYMNFFHQVGIVSYTNNGTKAFAGTDIGGVSAYSSTLNNDQTQMGRTNTVVAMHGVACEAATLAQFSGVPPGISTTTVVDKANRTAVVTIGGTKTTGNTLTLTVHDTALSGGTKSDTYTVLAADTLTTIAAGIAAAINADASLSAIGVTASSTGTVILISSSSINQTSYTSSTSGGATETITIAWSKIYLATSANWNAGINIKSTLTTNGFTAGEISSMDSYISGGSTNVLVGDQPNYVLGEWTGEGFWAFPFYTSNGGGGAYGLINGVYNGGGSQGCYSYTDSNGNLVWACLDQYNPYPNYVYGQGGNGIDNPNPGNNSSVGQQAQTGGGGGGGAGNGADVFNTGGGGGGGGQPTSSEPIGLFTGDYFYNHTDITVGSQGFPYGLAFGRSYSSANQYQNGPLGWGWTHNHAITATVSSDGFLGMGDQFAVQGAASIAELYVSMDIASDSTQPITKMITMSLADKWWVDQIVNNTVLIAAGSSTYFFVKQPDGSYTAPAASPSTLALSGGLFTLTTPQGIKYNFNSSGQISSWVSPAGVTVSYTYSSGLLSTISNGLGRTLTLNYTSGQLTSVTDGTGRSVGYGFDIHGNLTGFTDALSNETTFSYVSAGRITSIFLPANPTSAIVTNTYDSLSRVETQTDAYGNIWNYYFAGSRSEENNPNGYSMVYYFNRFGSPLTVTNQLGQTWTSLYDGLNRLITATAPEGNSATMVYNSLNLVTRTTAAPKPGSALSNIVTNFTWDPTWNKIKTAVDALSNTTTFNYDATTGNLLNIQPPLVGGVTPETSLTYNGRGQVLTVTDPTSIVTQLNYDATTEKLTSVVRDYGTGRLNLTTNLGYDSVGNCNSVQDPRGNTATAQFDNQRRLTQTTAPSPFSYISNLAYDNNGNRTQAQSQTGSPANPWQTTIAAYTIDNKVSSVTDPVGKISSVTFDTMRRLWKTTDALGRVVTRSYDNANRLYQVTDPATIICQTNLYSNNGLLASVEDANSNVTQYTRDGFDRPDKTIYPDSSFQESTSYDANSNVLTVTLRSGNTITLTYDVLNRLSTKAPQGQATVTMGYDLASRVTSVSVPVVAGDPSTGNFQMFYDTAGRFYKEEYPDTTTVVHQLDSNGNPTQTTYPDGYYINRVFDQLNRLTDIKLDGATTSALNFQYDALSRRTLLTYENGVTTAYSVDNVNRLTDLTQNFIGSNVSFAYGFDNVGQMSNIGVTDTSYTWRPSAAGIASYGTANSINQYPTVGGASYSYNSNGCLTGDGTWTFGFNTENTMISAAKTGVSAAYSYDPLMRQVLKNVGGTKTQFYYASAQRLADYNGSGTLLNRYVYGIGLDEVLIEVSASGTKTYYHQNHQGSIIATSNGSGAVLNKYTYSPWGESSSLTTTMHGFTGQRYDSETGLYYYKARYYSPTIGRFLQPDPIGYGNGMNIYSYVRNNPLNLTDPLGLSSDGSSLGVSAQTSESLNPADYPNSQNNFLPDFTAFVAWLLRHPNVFSVGNQNPVTNNTTASGIIQALLGLVQFQTRYGGEVGTTTPDGTNFGEVNIGPTSGPFANAVVGLVPNWNLNVLMTHYTQGDIGQGPEFHSMEVNTADAYQEILWSIAPGANNGPPVIYEWVPKQLGAHVTIVGQNPRNGTLYTWTATGSLATGYVYLSNGGVGSPDGH
jgi:RHS repeat-associated protein